MAGGTFTVNRSSIGTIIDTNCQIRTLTFVSPVSVVEPVSYTPSFPFLPATGTFCLADRDNYQNFIYNIDILGNGGWQRNVAVPITPAVPPSPKTIANLTCLSCPQGVSFTVVTA
jgi:hypothetical protein